MVSSMGVLLPLRLPRSVANSMFYGCGTIQQSWRIPLHSSLDPVFRKFGGKNWNAESKCGGMRQL
jgi:hypothetical protein